jgi:hypothetical protein
MKNRKNISKRNTLDSIIHHNFLSLNKQLARRDGILLDSGFYDTETWGGLRKCWKGFKIAKSDGDTKNMEYYANGIRRALLVPMNQLHENHTLGMWAINQR